MLGVGPCILELTHKLSCLAKPEHQSRRACLLRYKPIRRSSPVPILLWLLGVPLSVVVVLWLVHVI
jgi:hypothetical protein